MATTTTLTGMGLGFAVAATAKTTRNAQTGKHRKKSFIDCDSKWTRDQGPGTRDEDPESNLRIKIKLVILEQSAMTLFGVPHLRDVFVFVAKVGKHEPI
jgi:hypothetical protein